MGFTETCTRVSFPGDWPAAIGGGPVAVTESGSNLSTPPGLSARGLIDAPGREQRGSVCPDLSARERGCFAYIYPIAGRMSRGRGRGGRGQSCLGGGEGRRARPVTTWRGGRDTALAPKAAPHHPLSGPRRSFLTGASRVKGESLRDAFFRSWRAGKKPRRRPAGRSAKQQPDAALEAVRHRRDNGASGEGVRALSAGAITWLKSLHPKLWSAAGGLHQASSRTRFARSSASWMLRERRCRSPRSESGSAAAFDPERQTFQRERAEREKLQAEKDQEITRLEAELSRVEAERESALDALTKAGEELERERVERAKAESTARTLEAELRSFGTRAGRRWRLGWSVRAAPPPGSQSLRKVQGPGRLPGC